MPEPQNLTASLAEWLETMGFLLHEVEPAGITAGTWRCPSGSLYHLEYTWQPDSPAHGTVALWLQYPAGTVVMLFTAHRVATLEQAKAQLLGNVRFASAYAQVHPELSF